MIALAKRVEEVFLPGRAGCRAAGHSPGLQLLQRIRDEAHRFYRHVPPKQRRGAAARESMFDESQLTRGRAGAAARAAAALRLRPSASLSASAEELEVVPGVPAKTARNIYAQLHRAGFAPQR